MAVVSARLTHITETSKFRFKDRMSMLLDPITGDGQEIIAFRGECAADHLAGGRLLATAAPVNEWAADQPERQEADDWKKQDQQQPSRGRRRTSSLGHQAEGYDFYTKIEKVDRHSQEGHVGRRHHADSLVCPAAECQHIRRVAWNGEQ